MTTPPRNTGGWSPLAAVQTVRTQLVRALGATTTGRSRVVDLRETADGWTVVARLPGVASEEVAVEFDDRELCVRARSEEEVNADQGMRGSGSRTRTFEYRVTVPGRVDPDGIDAVMDHGLLTVRLPRAKRPRPRTITIGSRPAGARRSTVDPAADRELHRPDVDTTLRQPG